MSRALKVVSISALAFTCLFGAFSLVFYFGDWIRLLAVALMGVFVGVLAAPEFEPKAFKRPWLLQSGAGAFAGLTLGVAFHLEFNVILATTIIGCAIGWLAPSWVKHVQVP